MNFYLILSENWLLFSWWLFGIKSIEWAIIWTMAGFIKAFKKSFWFAIVPLIGMAIDRSNITQYSIMFTPLLFEVTGKLVYLYRNKVVPLRVKNKN